MRSEPLAPSLSIVGSAGQKGGGEGGDKVTVFRRWKNNFSTVFASTPTSDFLYSSPFLRFALFNRPFLRPPRAFPDFISPAKNYRRIRRTLRFRDRARVRAYVCKRRKNNGTELASNR